LLVQKPSKKSIKYLFRV